MAGAEGAGDKSFAVVQDSPAAKMQGTKSELEMAMSRTLETIAGPLKSVLDTATGLAQNFPVLTTAVVAATTAVGAMTAAAAAFGAMRMFSGGGGAAAMAAGATGWLSGGAGALARVGTKAMPWVAGAGMAAIDIVQTENNPTLTRAQKNIADAEAVGGATGGTAGALMGGALGTAVLPVIGTAIGAALGGLIGWWSGSNGAKGVASSIWGPSPESADSARKLVVEDKGTISVETTLNLDGREVARVVNEHNAAEAKRN